MIALDGFAQARRRPTNPTLAQWPLSAFMQPILDRTGAILANEILIRPVDRPGGADAYYHALLEVSIEDRLRAEMRSLRIALATAKATSGRCSVNVSLPMLMSDTALDRILQCVADVGPDRLIVEMLEHDYCQPDALIPRVERIIASGAVIAIDDFGRWHAPFALLAALPPPHWVKFDASIVHAPHSDHVLPAIIRAVHDIGSMAVAEYVDSAATLERVLAVGVDAVQGFHCGEPAPVADASACATG